MWLVCLEFGNKIETLSFCSRQDAGDFAQNLSDMFGECEFWADTGARIYTVAAHHVRIDYGF